MGVNPEFEPRSCVVNGLMEWFDDAEEDQDDATANTMSDAVSATASDNASDTVSDKAGDAAKG